MTDIVPPLLSEWRAQHPLRETLIYRQAALEQDARFATLAAEVYGFCPARVVGEHTSKSCPLAVVKYAKNRGVTFLVRDNFHDLNLAVLIEDNQRPLDVPLDLFYQVQDWSWYLHEIERAQGYSWKGWTDEEIADERIGRVKITNPNGHSYWSEKKWEEKERWLKRLVDPEWHGKNWGDALTVVGEMGPEARFAVIRRAFAQGMPESLLPYPMDRKRFIVATSWDLVADQMRAVLADLDIPHRKKPDVA